MSSCNIKCLHAKQAKLQQESNHNSGTRTLLSTEFQVNTGEIVFHFPLTALLHWPELVRNEDVGATLATHACGVPPHTMVQITKEVKVG